MVFSSYEFVAFFVVVYALYIVSRHYFIQNILLLVSSYFFYGFNDWKMIFLLFGYTVGSYVISLTIFSSDDRRFQKILLATGIAGTLGVLGFYKYFDFGIRSASSFLEALGLQANLQTLNILLPIGISFYTFQSMAYMIDVYRGRVQPPRNFVNYALYISFFPQLIAGPIERPHRLMPQISAPRVVTLEHLRVGVAWVVLGYLLKSVVADTLAPMVDYAFSHTSPSEASGATTLVGVLAFGLQIYGDFAGYSLIARGLAKLLGIDLMANFAGPFLAASPREFWHRWHISLSTWLRDYLYISLGGSRKGVVRTYVNLMITMTLGGLWHGANWNYIIWGIYQGALIAAQRAIPAWAVTPATLAGRLVGIVVTYVLVHIGWLFFRAESYDQFVRVVTSIFTNFKWEPQTGEYLTVYLALLAIALCYQLVEERHGDNFVAKLNPYALLYLAALLLLLIMSIGFSTIPFIYFRF